MNQFVFNISQTHSFDTILEDFITKGNNNTKRKFYLSILRPIKQKIPQNLQPIFCCPKASCLVSPFSYLVSCINAMVQVFPSKSADSSNDDGKAAEDICFNHKCL